MKVLWLSNVAFSSEQHKSTGTWTQPLAESMQQMQNLEIGNVSFGNTRRIESILCNGIVQYLIPDRKRKEYGTVACNKTINDIQFCINDFKPDILHVWGTEAVWANAALRVNTEARRLLEIQGIISAYSQYFLGGLQPYEIQKAIGLKEILMPWRRLVAKQKVFIKRGRNEIENIRQYTLISTQSDWVRNHIRIINPDAELFSTRIMLRDEFVSAEPWIYKQPTDHPILFSSCSAAVSYKAVHQLLRMLLILKKRFPNIELRLAGIISVGNRLLDGYSVYLINYIKKYNLENNVTFLGSISSDLIVRELQNANVCVIPSFVETYCLALAEALIVGTPCVVSYTSALPETAIPNEEALFYNSQDYVTAAANVVRLIENQDLATRLSSAAQNRRLIENNPDLVAKTQMEIYDMIMSK